MLTNDYVELTQNVHAMEVPDLGVIMRFDKSAVFVPGATIHRNGDDFTIASTKRQSKPAKQPEKFDDQLPGAQQKAKAGS